MFKTNTVPYPFHREFCPIDEHSWNETVSSTVNFFLHCVSCRTQRSMSALLLCAEIAHCTVLVVQSSFKKQQQQATVFAFWLDCVYLPLGSHHGACYCILSYCNHKPAPQGFSNALNHRLDFKQRKLETTEENRKTPWGTVARVPLATKLSKDTRSKIRKEKNNNKKLAGFPPRLFPILMYHSGSRRDWPDLHLPCPKAKPCL